MLLVDYLVLATSLQKWSPGSLTFRNSFPRVVFLPHSIMLVYVNTVQVTACDFQDQVIKAIAASSLAF